MSATTRMRYANGVESIKPLRNYLRQFECPSLLHAIWHLANHVEFGRPLPAHLASANPNSLRNPLQLGFFLWELDTLAREAILHCDPERGKAVTGWPQIATALNKLKAAEEEVLDVDETNVLAEMTRIAHRQFHWQQGVSHNDFARTRRIYRGEAMNDVVREVYGLSAEEVATAGFALFATFMDHVAITDDWSWNTAPLLGFDPRPLVENLTADFAALRRSAMDSRSLGRDWAYAFNPLWLHPLIRFRKERPVICPIPGLLARRITDGLYFDIAGHDVDALSAAMGPAFQSYIGEALDRANAGRFEILSEQAYGKKRYPKDSVDFIVADRTASLFIEVKILKMARAAKEHLAPNEIVTAQLRKLARAIGQLYATLADALAGGYPHWKPDGHPVHPMLVTLDNWNLFTHEAHGQVASLVGEELDRRGLDRGLLETNRYVVCSANELESAIQVMHEVGIHEVIRDLTIGDRMGWLFGGHLRSSFEGELTRTKPLFPEERAAILRSGRG